MCSRITTIRTLIILVVANTNQPYENENISSTDPSQNDQWDYPPNYPVPYYWHDYYWPYYYPNYPNSEFSKSGNERSSKENSPNSSPRNSGLFYWNYGYPAPVPHESSPPPCFPPPPPPPPPYWEAYGMYPYYYGYPPMYSPYPAHPANAEENAGYSSMDECSQYNNNPSATEDNKTCTPKIVVTPTLPEEHRHFDTGEDTSAYNTDIETEIEVDQEDTTRSLQAIRSVSNINVYGCNSNLCPEQLVEEPDSSDSSDDEDDDDNDSNSVYVVDDESTPQHLSTIYEESERSDSRFIRESSVTTTVSEDFTYVEDASNEAEIDAAVAPLELKLTNCEDQNVSKDSHLERNANDDEDDKDWWGIINNDNDEIIHTKRQNKVGDCEAIEVENEAVQEEREEEDISEINESEQLPESNYSEVDFWQTLKSNENSEGTNWNTTADKHSICNEDVQEYDSDSDTSSTSSSDSSSCTSNVSEMQNSKTNEENVLENEDCKNNLYSKTEQVEETAEENVEVPSIKDRIRSLQNSVLSKRNSIDEETASKISVKDKISVFEASKLLQATETTVVRRSKLTSNNSSRKSFEDYSEEEIDSGVTSDISRHTSETNPEDFPELRKMSKYQRAATHSRLYKLLQDECDNDEEDEENENRGETESTALYQTQPCREHLTLPLKKNVNESESFSSSGINSPGSGEFVNDKLVSELIQSMLLKKKGQAFRSLPLEKLHTAAIRILQEEIDVMDLSSDECSSFLSPLRNSTQSSTPMQTPQEFYANYSDYKQYYDSWSDAASNDTVPTRSFKLLQEQTNRSGLLGKCPRVLSAKNVHKELSKLLENHESVNHLSDNTLDSLDKKEAANAS